MFSLISTFKFGAEICSLLKSHLIFGGVHHELFVNSAEQGPRVQQHLANTALHVVFRS